jgi:hypothetical protein
MRLTSKAAHTSCPAQLTLFPCLRLTSEIARIQRKRQSKHKLDERGILLITDAERPRQLG